MAFVDERFSLSSMEEAFLALFSSMNSVQSIPILIDLFRAPSEGWTSASEEEGLSSGPRQYLASQSDPKTWAVEPRRRDSDRQRHTAGWSSRSSPLAHLVRPFLSAFNARATCAKDQIINEIQRHKDIIHHRESLRRASTTGRHCRCPSSLPPRLAKRRSRTCMRLSQVKPTTGTAHPPSARHLKVCSLLPTPFFLSPHPLSPPPLFLTSPLLRPHLTLPPLPSIATLDSEVHFMAMRQLLAKETPQEYP